MTAASPNVLIVRGDVSEQIVYDLTRMLWENLLRFSKFTAPPFQCSLREPCRAFRFLCIREPSAITANGQFKYPTH